MSNGRHPHPRPAGLLDGQRGVALIEALVALLIMAFGMIALVGLQANMRRSADVAKQRGEAIRLAQQQMEQLRDYSVLATPNPPVVGVRAFDDVATAINTNAGDANSNANFALTRTVTSWPGQPAAITAWQEPQQKALNISVNWVDRAGDTQFVVIDSFITGIDPSLSGSLRWAPDSAPLRRPAGRDASIPVSAKDLGGGISAFKPQPSGNLVWIFNNTNGLIIGKCTFSTNVLVSSLTVDDVSTCRNNASGYLLSGFVNFSTGTTPDSARPGSTAMPLRVTLTMTPDTGTYPLTPSYECYDDAPSSTVTTATVVSYYCIVYPNTATPPAWSGKLTIDGIALAATASDPVFWKICRYSADYDANGSISNAEHPLTYANVTSSLTRQNFLVISSTASCPTGQAPDPSQGIFSNTSTLLHQPV